MSATSGHPGPSTTERESTAPSPLVDPDLYLEVQKVARIGFWEMDRVSNELIWSEMVYEIFQLDPDEYAPSLEAFWSLVHPEDREIGRQAMAESLFNQTPYDFVHRLLLGDGTVKWVHERARTRYDSDGAALRTLGTMADITAIREAENQLRQAQKMESLDQLTAGVAHEFNNLLGVMRISAESAAAKTPRADPRRSSLDAILQAAERGTSLTRQLLAFSREQAFSMVDFDLNELVDELAALLERIVDDRITFSRIRHPAPLNVHGDRDQLGQVLLNLVLNGSQAMPGGGELSVSVSPAKGPTIRPAGSSARSSDLFAELSVTDTGSGMPPEVRDKVFEPFYTTKPRNEGTGLGLSVAQGIVQQHGGSISVRSRVGLGSEFQVLLPLC